MLLLRNADVVKGSIASQPDIGMMFDVRFFVQKIIVGAFMWQLQYQMNCSNLYNLPENSMNVVSVEKTIC